jgi:hypothetical protein
MIATRFMRSILAEMRLRFAVLIVIVGGAAACLAANRVAPNTAQLHWLFGANPFGLSFMIGVGQRFSRRARLCARRNVILSREDGEESGRWNKKRAPPPRFFAHYGAQNDICALRRSE